MGGYIIQRTGWDQWLDDGDVWRVNMAFAQFFPTREAAEQKAEGLRVVLGKDGVIIVPV